MKELLIERQRLRHNLGLIRERARGTALCGVLTSDAFGLGLLPVARMMREEGVHRFAVGEPEDAALLRREGFSQEELLLLRPTTDPREIELLLDCGCCAAIGSQEAALALAGIAERRSTVAEAHVKIDTGFGRYGFLPSETEKAASVIHYMQSVAVSGVFTQLDAAAPKKFVAAQLRAFDGVLGALRAQGLETGTVHAVCSSALFRFGELPLFDMVRVGEAAFGRASGRHGLQKVGVACAGIASVRWLPAGSPMTHGTKLRRPMRVGIVPFGTADGFDVGPGQTAAGLFAALLRGRPAGGYVRAENGEWLKIIGRPGQDYLTVDLTHSSAGEGSAVFLDVDPLYAARLPKKYT